MFDNLNYKTDGRDLTINEFKKLTSFLFVLNKNRMFNLIYRGDNYDNLKKKLNLFDDNDAYSKLSHFIFLIGEKGRIYQKEYREKILNDKKVYPINLDEDNVFDFIFRKLNKVLTNKIQHQAVDDFIKNNLTFYEYFIQKSNRTNFISIINTNDDDKFKIKIRDYYLSLLHKIGGIGFYNNSFFVSTSSEFKVAKKFSNNLTESQGIVFISWVKKFNSSNIKRILSQLNLPTFDKSFFSNQNETSMKGGLLPQYILGYVILDENEFVINPNLFSTTKPNNKILFEGIDINQKSFHTELNETNYCGFFNLDEDNNYSDSNS